MKKLLFWLAVSCCIVLGAEVDVRPLTEQRVLFFGDSITRGGYYVTAIQLFEALRHPDRPVNVINGGISGDTAQSALLRLGHDILPQKPERVLIMFGMNDVGRHWYKADRNDAGTLENRKRYLERYRENMNALVEGLQKEGIRVDLILPTPFDQYGELAAENLPGCNDALAECAAIMRKIAADKGCAVIDLHNPMTELLKKYPEKHLCGPDRVHPQLAGHFIMSGLILKAMHEPPFVAKTEIDAAGNTVKTENAEVSGLRRDSHGVSFSYAPRALPYPIADYYSGVDREIFPYTKELNREMLIVTGLPAGKYILKAGDKKLSEFSASELARGVNLALLKTPSQEIAGKALQISWQLHRAVHAIRGIKQTDIIVINNHGNPADFDNAATALKSWIEPRKSAYWLSVLNTYMADKPKENEYIRQREMLREELYRTARPVRYGISIIHSSSAEQ